MTKPAPRRRFALAMALGTTMLAAACSGTGGPPASAGTTFPPIPTEIATPSAPPWPEEWPSVVCDARASLDDAAGDIAQGVDAAADGQPAAVANFAEATSATTAQVGDALDALTEWDRGRGVAVNLRSAATHLGKAASQLSSWSDRPRSARLTTARKELAAARTNLTRAATNQKSLAKATGFSCQSDESVS